MGKPEKQAVKDVGKEVLKRGAKTAFKESLEALKGTGAKVRVEVVKKALSAEEKTGVIYERINRKTGEKYIGQSKSPKRFEVRKMEHNKKLSEEHDYNVIDKNIPKKELDFLEETRIREGGGLQKEGGSLVNKRHQMSDARYKEAGVEPNKPVGPKQ